MYAHWQPNDVRQNHCIPHVYCAGNTIYAFKTALLGDIMCLLILLMSVIQAGVV